MTTKRLPRPRDPIQLGKLIGDIATGQVEDRSEDATKITKTARRRKKLSSRPQSTTAIRSDGKTKRPIHS
jgi:hypothetical protein